MTRGIPKQLVLHPEEVIEKIMHVTAGDRKLWTVKELEEALLGT